MDDIPSNIGYLANNFNIGYIQNGSTNRFKWIVKEKNGIKYWKRYDLIKDNPLNPSTPRKETFNIDNLNSLSRKKSPRIKNEPKKEDKIAENKSKPKEDKKPSNLINIGEIDILKDARVRKYLNEMRGKERQKIDKLKKKYTEENMRISRELNEEKSKREDLEREKQEYVRKKELRKIALMERRKKMKEANRELNENNNIEVINEINNEIGSNNEDKSNNLLVAKGGRKVLTPRRKISRRGVKFTKKVQVFNYIKESVPSLNSSELNIYMDKL